MGKVDINKFWIEGVLTGAFPRFVEDGGADLDGNGIIDEGEKFGDLNDDGRVGDRGDYVKYLQENRSLLSAAIPFFKWGQNLSVTNRIHELLYLESDFSSDTQFQSAYAFITMLVEDANEKIGNRKLSPQEESSIYYAVMKEAGIKFIGQEDSSFINNIEKRELDCDTSSFMAMAIGDELGIVLRPVPAPCHIFLRGKGRDGKEFNIDYGELTSDGGYEVDPDLIGRKVYLQTLNDHQLEGQFLSNRGLVLYKLGRLDEALAAYDSALAINSNDAEVHLNRGNVLDDLGQLDEALAAYDRALAIDPKDASAHYNRGYVLDDLGRFKKALAAYDRAIAINPKHAKAHFNRGYVLRKLGRFKKALAAYDRALAINPKHAKAHFNRGVVLEKLGRLKEARAAYKKARQPNPGLKHK
ncbi:MAG: tetratricopeptide repeat protein [Pseudomonadota bacterium]